MLCLMFALSSLPTPAMASGNLCRFIKLPASSDEIDRLQTDVIAKLIQSVFSDDSLDSKNFISPTAEFELWRGDTSRVGRSKGKNGFVEFVKDLKPRSYTMFTADPGPIAISSLDKKCGYSVSLLFETEEENESALVDFSFEDGLLTKASGAVGAIVKGIFKAE
jgi:hypothetical protein